MGKGKDKKSHFSKLKEFEKASGNQYEQNLNNNNTTEERLSKSQNSKY